MDMSMKQIRWLTVLVVSAGLLAGCRWLQTNARAESDMLSGSSTGPEEPDVKVEWQKRDTPPVAPLVTRHVSLVPNSPAGPMQRKQASE